MKLKLIFTLLITFFCYQFTTAQTVERVPADDIIRLVTDAHSKNNYIFNDLIENNKTAGNELRKMIYSANTELLDIRKMLVANPTLKREDYEKLQNPIAALRNAIDTVDKSSSVDTIKQAISKVHKKAKVVKKIIKKAK